MKRILFYIGIFALIGILIMGYNVYTDLNKLEEVFKSEHNLDDASFVTLNKRVSPNKNYTLYEYQFDNGGFGYSRAYWSVIKNGPWERSLEKGLLPDGYKAIGWTATNELVIGKWVPYYDIEKEVELSNKDMINGVSLKIKSLPNSLYSK